MSSEAETSSSKRAASEEPGASTLSGSDGMRVVPSLLPSNISSTNDAEVDEYMSQQDQAGADANVADELDPTLRGDERLRQIDELKKAPLVPGETWYLLGGSWFEKWISACTGMPLKSGATVSEATIGPVDNSQLLNITGALKEVIIEGTDYELVPEAAWKLLEEWYGPCEHPIARKVITRGINKETRIEFHPPRITLYRLVPGTGKDLSGDSEVSFETSKAAKIDDVIAAAAQHLDLTVDHSNLRAWRVDGVSSTLDSLETRGRDYPVGRLEEDDATLWPGNVTSLEHIVESTTLDHGDSLVIEQRIDEKWIVDDVNPVPLLGGDWFAAKFPSQIAGASRGIAASKSLFASSSNAITVRNRPVQPSIKRGTMGLVNLGNTCFMNSALQCLAHTQELTEYFLTGVYKDELNPSNPLGMQGAIAEAFGALLQRLYETGSSSMAPREFKTSLQRFAPQFIGYQQHDSQELLAFLLDGLHEDLNRILKKPYVENPDWEGGGDKELIELARTTWNGYLSRNDSVIVDLFQGQYKSTLICPECSKVSITFDPFMYLTLPLPVDRRWSHAINFVPLSPKEKALTVPVDLHANSSVRDIKNLLGRWLGKDAQKMQIVEVWSNKVYKHFDDGHPVSQITKTDVIVCYELPCKVSATRKASPPEDYIIVPIYHRTAKSTPKTLYSSYQSFDLFGQPLLVAFTLSEAKDPQQIYNALVHHYARWTPHARDLYTWTPSGSETEETASEPDGTQVTEYREDGEVVADGHPQTTSASPEPDTETDAMDVDSIELVGPKQSLFTLHIFPTSGELETQWALGKEALWADREREMESETGPPSPAVRSSKSDSSSNSANNSFGLLRRGDIIMCEWQPHVQQYFFGEKEKEKDALWARLEHYVHPEYTQAQADAEAKKNRTLNLDDCLDEFTREEKLGEDDLWYCPRCKKHQQATKKFEIWKLPDILVVHLKRFSNSRILRDKIETLVDFPVEGLDLEARVGERQALKALASTGEVPAELTLDDMDEPLVYDLYGVDEHMGGLGGGHYRAYAKNPEDGVWYHFDDSHVTRSQPKEAVNAYAYLLFYRRRAKRPIGGKTYEIVDAARSKAVEEPVKSTKPAEQLPTPNDSPPRYPNKLPDTPDQLVVSPAVGSRMKSPFDTPGTSPATPADEDEISSAYDNQLVMGSIPLASASPSSSNEAEWDSDEASRPYNLSKAFQGPSNSLDWDGSPRTPGSDGDFDQRVAVEDDGLETIDGLRQRHDRMLFGDDGGEPQ